MAGHLTTKEIMEKHGIKNKSQIETWMRWYRANEIHRFDQPIGKQYSFGHGPEFASENEKKEPAKFSFKNGKRNLKKVFGNVKGVEKRIVLQLVEKFRGKYTVTTILSALDVPRSNYYRWLAEGIPIVLSLEEEAIIELCKKTNYRNGHRKIKALLKRDYRIILNRNTVQKIMQKHNLKCGVKPKRKWKSQGDSVVVAPNLLERNFTATGPNQKWVTDITYIQYGSTTLYLSTILDLFNNEIVAYKLYDHQQTPLVIDTLEDALQSRGNSEGIIIHSDQGSVYTSYAYQDFVKQNHLVSSMSRRGNCWDNAVIESFHSNLKSEDFQYTKFNSISNIDVVKKVDDYLRHYNEERIQEKLGYLTPREYGIAAA